MLSVVIPARNEQFLIPTIQSLIENATGEVEVIVVLDGYWPIPQIPDWPQLRIIHKGEAKGMRAAINSAVAIARGEYIMKIDAHCMVGKGYDQILAADCEKDWVVVPTRKRLDAENWCIQDVGKPDVDYMFLSYPSDNNDFGGAGLNGKNWNEKNSDATLKDKHIDDLMSAQGSCWFMHKEYFYFLELMDEESYGAFWNEMQEIGLKCWLSGGRMIVNKKTWYAHLHKGKKYGRGYHLPSDWLNKGAEHTKLWLGQVGDAWYKQTLPLSFLIEKFWPVPTWPEDRNLWTKKTSGAEQI